jgi:molybdopterin-synthase adenylyltransferase
VASISSSKALAAREVELAALRQGVVPRRYLRSIGTIGIEGQISLLESTVAVAGAGGLGGTIIELLARQGVGHLIIIDDGCFSESDLNRQIMSTEKNLRQPKIAVAAERIRATNSSVQVSAFRERLTAENCRRLLKGARVVADGLDNLPSRFAVEHACRDLQIPYVYGAIAGLGGQLMTIFPEDRGLSLIYGSADAVPEHGIEALTGTPPTTPAIIAALQVQEVMKVLTGLNSPVRNQLLMVDLAEGTIDRIQLRA